MLRWVVADAQFNAEDHAGNFRPQFLPGVALASEWMRQVTIETGRVTSGVTVMPISALRSLPTSGLCSIGCSEPGNQGHSGAAMRHKQRDSR